MRGLPRAPLLWPAGFCGGKLNSINTNKTTIPTSSQGGRQGQGAALPLPSLSPPAGGEGNRPEAEARWDSNGGAAGAALARPGRHGAVSGGAAARDGAEAERQRCVRRPRSPLPSEPVGAPRRSPGLGPSPPREG